MCCGVCSGDCSAVNDGPRPMTLDRVRLAALADYLAAAVVISLPWSTSATSILVPLWVIAVALTLDGGSLRQVGAMPAAALPIALVVLAVAGMLWADVAWPERLSGAAPFVKLLVLPLLFIHFSRSRRGEMVLAAFFTSACVLLAVSWSLALFPQIPWKVKVAGRTGKRLHHSEWRVCAVWFRVARSRLLSMGPVTGKIS